MSHCAHLIRTLQATSCSGIACYTQTCPRIHRIHQQKRCIHSSIHSFVSIQIFEWHNYDQVSHLRLIFSFIPPSHIFFAPVAQAWRDAAPTNKSTTYKAAICSVPCINWAVAFGGLDLSSCCGFLGKYASSNEIIERACQLGLTRDDSSRAHNQDLCRGAAEKGNLVLLQWLGEKSAYADAEYIGSSAVEAGNLPILRWLRETDGDWSNRLMSELLSDAACGGHLAIARYLRQERGAEWGRRGYHNGHLTGAAQHNHLDFVDYARSDNCRWNEDGDGFYDPQHRNGDWCRGVARTATHDTLVWLHARTDWPGCNCVRHDNGDWKEVAAHDELDSTW
jgi:hypothetical protein